MPRRCLPILSLLLLMMASAVGSAQDLPTTTPRGILVDRVLPLAHLEQLDGTAQATPVTPARWRQVVHELSRAAEAPSTWPTAAALRSRPERHRQGHAMTLGLVHARYDRLGQDGALLGGEVFSFAPLNGETYHGAHLDLVLDPALILRHGTEPALSYTLDADDGLGPRPLLPGQVFPVRYARQGRHTLTLKAGFADGRTLQARASVEVRRLITPDPDATWPLTASEPFEGEFASGEAFVMLAPGHTAVTNPVVVVEGFDLDNTMDWPVLYDLLNQENLLQDLLAAGHDALVLNFSEATEPIQRNAFVLTELLQRLDGELPPGRSLVVVGASMGGLVSRYALTWMENQGLEHRARAWISFDSPHGGANIPLGVQHWLRFFEDESAEAAFLLSRLDTPAARQMLLYHHSATSGTTAGAGSERAAWLADLDAVGGWPQLPRRVAVANGSGAGQDQGFGPGAQLIDYTYRSTLVDVDGNVWAVPDGGAAQTIFDGEINLIWPLPDTEETVSVGGTTAWDGAPGGNRDSMAQMDLVEAPYGDIIALHDRHCFIPTVSALALEGVGPFHDIAGDPDLMARTAFDRLYWPTENQEHILITPENKGWFMQEIFEGISAVPLPAIPGAPRLAAAPNPFNPSTELRLALPAAGRIAVRIYDVKGRLVRVLAENRLLPAGETTLAWDGRGDGGRVASSGVYLVRLETADAAVTQRIVLAK